MPFNLVSKVKGKNKKELLIVMHVVQVMQVLQDCKTARLQDRKTARPQDRKTARLQDCKTARP
jgi:hypothetical protein